MRRTLALLVAAGLVALLLAVVSPSQAVAAPGTWLSRINTYRAQNGRGPLTEDPSTSVVAQTWTQTMASTNTLAHNPQYTQQVTTPRERIGENVGYNFSEAALFQAFLASPLHKANILGDYNAIGIGQVYANGFLWTTHIFLFTNAVLQPPPGGRPWASLGGTITSDPDAASWASGRLDVFARGANNAVWQKTYENGWYGWADHGGQIVGSPTAVSWGPGRIDVFGRGTDNALWQKYWNGTSWSAWGSLGGVLTSDPEVASWAAGRLDVFARGAKNTIVHKTYQNGWYPWADLGGQFLGGPGAVSWGANRIDVFGRGTDNALWHKYWNGTSWSGWGSQGGALTSDPDVASWAPGRLDVFARGTNNAMYHKYYASGWSAWADLGGQFVGGPTAVSWGPGRIDVFGRGTDNALWHKYWNGTSW